MSVLTRCSRCDTPREFGAVCATCDLTAFLKAQTVFAELVTTQGPRVLLRPVVQARVALIAAAANPDADVDGVDWPALARYWHRPS
jgi:hypothetical protein